MKFLIIKTKKEEVLAFFTPCNVIMAYLVSLINSFVACKVSDSI